MHTGRYVIMGVAGAGKSEIGAAFAHALGVAFVEGDTYHSAMNIERMAAGVPLTDDDRQDWLMAIAARLRESQRAGVGVVISCSALKRRYRDLLREGAPDVRFIYLSGARTLLGARLAQRRGHFMPPSMLDSQLAILEAPTDDEAAWEYDIDAPPAAIVGRLLARATSSHGVA